MAPETNPAPLHGVIDLGTHSCLLLVGRRTAEGELEVVHDACEIPRMGEGLQKSGRLGEAAMQRTLGVLRDFQETATALGVVCLEAGGTAALRRAHNGAEFIRRVREQLGLTLRQISESEEAELGWIAATACLAGLPPDLGHGQVVVVDVGGGSTEVVAAQGARLQSFPVGAVVLTEEYGLDGRPETMESKGDLHNLVARLEADFAPLRTWLPSPRTTDVLLVALGGTACNLGSLELGLNAFDHRSAEGLAFDASSAQKWAELLAGESLGARCLRPIEAERAPVLPAGLACLGQVAKAIGANKLVVTGRGLRYGLLRRVLGLG